jgi:hypothetical protein
MPGDGAQGPNTMGFPVSRHKQTAPQMPNDFCIGSTRLEDIGSRLNQS